MMFVWGLFLGAFWKGGEGLIVGASYWNARFDGDRLFVDIGQGGEVQ